MSRLTRKGFHNGLAGFWVKENNGTESFISWRDDGYEAIAKLNYIEDLEEAGRLIELPCAVGDTVWEIVLLPMLPEDGMKESYIIWEKELRLEDIEDFGKTVFLTKEEAEAKLKEVDDETMA